MLRILEKINVESETDPDLKQDLDPKPAVK
jgi:hypothetical protein